MSLTKTAGSSITVEMHQQPGDRSCSNEGIGGNHFGPVLVYMSKVDDAAAADDDGTRGSGGRPRVEFMRPGPGRLGFAGGNTWNLVTGRSW